MTYVEHEKLFLGISLSLKASTITRRLKTLVKSKNDDGHILNLNNIRIKDKFSHLLSYAYADNQAALLIELFQYASGKATYVNVLNDAFSKLAGSNSHGSDKAMTALLQTGSIDVGWNNYKCLIMAAKNSSYQAFRTIINFVPNVDLSVLNNSIANEVFVLKNKDSIYAHNARLIWRDFFEKNDKVLSKAVELNQIKLLPDPIKDVFVF